MYTYFQQCCEGKFDIGCLK